MTKREPPHGGLLALHPAVIEVLETAVAEEVEQGIASVAPANVRLPTDGLPATGDCTRRAVYSTGIYLYV